MSYDLKVDFSGRLEAVHRDGRIGGVEPHARPFSYGQVYGGLAGIGHWDQHYGGWDERGEPCNERNPWRIRNVAEPKGLINSETLSDDLAKRMEACIRAAAAGKPFDMAEARAIVALLPKPVDADEQYARDLIREMGWSGEKSIGSEAVVSMIAKAHRDTRALERDSREG